MSQQVKRKTKRLLDFQGCNQLGTPGRPKSFLRGGQIFKLCAIVSKYVQHIFPVGAKIFLRWDSPPWLQACGLPNITENKHFLAYFIHFSKIPSCKPRCAPASPAAHLQCSTARIWWDLSAAWLCSCKLLWRSDECVSFPYFNVQPVVFAVMNCCVVALSLFFSNSLT